MAKKKKNKIAKRRYRAGGKIERLDMRNGGRVQLLEGGDPLKREEEEQDINVPPKDDDKVGQKRDVPPVDDRPTGGSFSIGRDDSQDDRVITTHLLLRHLQLLLLLLLLRLLQKQFNQLLKLKKL